MTDLVTWPRGILVPRHCNPDPVPANVAGTASLSGFRQTVASAAAIWRITYEACRVTGRHRHTWRALQVQVEGRATPIVLPVYERDELRLLGVATAATSHYGDGTTHGDGSGFASMRSQVLVRDALALRARQAWLTTILGPALRAGQHFSIGVRLYRIASIDATSGADTQVTFWPPARDTVIAGAECAFDRPVCKVRLQDDLGLALKLDTGIYGLPNVTFLEDPR